MSRDPPSRGAIVAPQFLEFVVEQAIAGNFDQLKERLIGVEFFNRQPSYDKGEDAIVRVTASDVRKRLLPALWLVWNRACIPHRPAIRILRSTHQ